MTYEMLLIYKIFVQFYVQENEKSFLHYKDSEIYFKIR